MLPPRWILWVFATPAVLHACSVVDFPILLIVTVITVITVVLNVFKQLFFVCLSIGPKLKNRSTKGETFQELRPAPAPQGPQNCPSPYARAAVSHPRKPIAQLSSGSSCLGNHMRLLDWQQRHFHAKDLVGHTVTRHLSLPWVRKTTL